MQLKAKAKAKAKTVKEMAAGWKKTRDEPVPDDHAEGEDEEPKEEDATVADDEHRSYPKVRKCARMIKSGQVPEDLQQLYEEGSKNSPPPRLFTSQFIQQSLSAEHQVASLCCSWKYPVRGFQEELWDLHQQISGYWVASLHHVVEKIQWIQQALNEQKDEMMSIRKMVTIMPGQ